MFKIEGYALRIGKSEEVQKFYFQVQKFSDLPQTIIPNGPNGAIFAHFWPFLEVFGQNENV